MDDPFNAGDGSTVTDGWQDTDTITNLYAFKGTDLNDVFTINIINNNSMNELIWYVMGMGGDDLIETNVIDESNDGTNSHIMALYTDDTAGIYANLSQNFVHQGNLDDGTYDPVTGIYTGSYTGGLDTLVNINHVSGTNFNDILTGNDNYNFFIGTDGNDKINGMGEENEISYYHGDIENPLFNGVIVNLGTVTDPVTGVAPGTAVGKQGNLDYNTTPLFTDTLTNIENVTGSEFDDILIGNSDRNDFSGTEGDDIINGMDGRDDVSYDWAIDNPLFNGIIVDLGASTVTAIGKQGDLDYNTNPLFIDTLISIENVTGSRFDDELTGIADQDNYFDGTLGDDIIDGGGGNGWNSIDYDERFWHPDFNGVVVTLGDGDAAGTATGKGLDYNDDAYTLFTDTLYHIDGVTGSTFSDDLTGNADHNHFNGTLGDDIIDGGDNWDHVSYKWDIEHPDYAGVIIDLSKVLDINIPDDYFNVTGKRVDNPNNDDPLFTDTLISIQGITGSDFDDELTGSIDDGDPTTNEGNHFNGTEGDDIINGMDGYNTLSYVWDIRDPDFDGVIVDLSFTTNNVIGKRVGNPSNDDPLFTDTVTNINRVEGSRLNDTLIGDGGDNRLEGHEGFDILKGGAGNDYLYGGSQYEYLYEGGTERADMADYSDSSSGIRIEMNDSESLYVYDAYGVTNSQDYLNGIEWIRGTNEIDTVNGDGRFLFLEGGAGNDILFNIEGASYWSAPTGVTINLNNATLNNGDYVLTVADGYGGGSEDTLTNVEELMGSQNEDFLTGQDNVHNAFIGGGYIDWINGGAIDFIQGGDISNTAIYALDPAGIEAMIIWDGDNTTPTSGGLGGWVNDGFGAASIDNLTNITDIVGSMHDDVMTIDSIDNAFEGQWMFSGWAGDDEFNGSARTDEITMVSYSDDPNGVEVHLSGDNPYTTGGQDEDGYAIDGWGDYDTLNYIDDVVGSSFDDELYGNYLDNILFGGDGEDTLTGLGGNDFFRFQDADSIDTIKDFTSVSGSSGENDLLQFDHEDYDFHANGLLGADDHYTSASLTDTTTYPIADPTQHRVIGVIDTVDDSSDPTNWSNPFSAEILSVLNGAIDAGAEIDQSYPNYNDGSSYLIVSNGTDSRAYYWEGDRTGDDVINASELRQFAELENFSDIASLDENNFDIEMQAV